MKSKPEYYNDSVKEIGNGFVIVEQKFILKEGKTTTEGKYPKLESDDNCSYPERASCDHGEFFKRCPLMKYDNSKNKWFCDYKK